MSKKILPWILFMAAGAFQVSKPSDLLPELQGRFPIRVRMDVLTEQAFVAYGHKLQDRLESFHLVLGFLVLSLALILIVKARQKRAITRSAQASRAPGISEEVQKE